MDEEERRREKGGRGKEENGGGEGNRKKDGHKGKGDKRIRMRKVEKQWMKKKKG